jgi:nitrite reductase/ring-hydroxylating ferredoxin subunit
MNRRDLYRYGTIVLGNLVALVLAVPGVAYLIDPLRRKSRQGNFTPLTRLDQLAAGQPRAFPIIDVRQDAWVEYPPEPIGSVWLIRQPEGAKEPVIALTAECPHLGCAVNLAADGKSFLCPCHTSNFDFQGKPLNAVPPRPMDRLEVKLSRGNEPDSEVQVKFQRFRTQSEEKIPLA